MNEEFPLGEMVMMDAEEYELLESDLEYWVSAATMLSELLSENGIEHEVNEQSVAEFLIRKDVELM